MIMLLVARRAGGREGWRFGSLARGSSLRQPTDEIVLTAAKRGAPDGLAVSRELVMHGIQLHQPS
jgi:hypothetical protein